MEKKALPQKLLLYLLYSLIILMIVFSFMAIGDKGMQGYEQCVEEICVKYGDAICQKTRTINNCCLGAGGQLAQAAGKLTCTFN